MAQFSGGQMQGPPTGWCDYCHQKPKFPPYNYCGRVCGSRAKATGGTGPSSPAMCKQCGQKPVYKGHQFCGRNCANAWQGMYGQIHTSGSGQPQRGQQSWNAMPPPQMHNPFINPTPPFQGSNQGGDGGSSIGGIVRSLKGFVSQSHQLQSPQPPQPPQQQPSPPNPPQMQQVSGPTSPDPLMISPPISPMPSGMGGPTPPGNFDPTPPGYFDPLPPESPTPTSPGLNQYYSSPPSPTNPGTQDPNANDQTNGRNLSPPPFPAPRVPNQSSTQGQPMSNTMNLAMNMNPPTYSADDGTQPNQDPDLSPLTDPSQDPAANSNHHPNIDQGQNQNARGLVPVQAQAQARFSIQAINSPPMGAGGYGNGNLDPSDPNYFPSQQPTSTSSGSPMVCRLNGCNKPVFMDPATHHQSEYCSQRHREDATIFGQVNPCIMCLKMPRGPNDHFCSRVCRDKALSP